MPFEPTGFEPDAEPVLHDLSGAVVWSPILHHACAFGPETFDLVMTNLIENPNLNSSWLFRADILYDSQCVPEHGSRAETVQTRVAELEGFHLERALVRRLIPRNANRDDPLDQTCLFLRRRCGDGKTESVVIYIPHVSTSQELPFYHPKVHGVAHLHEWNGADAEGTVSVHYRLLHRDDIHDNKLRRTAQMLLSILHKHGQGLASGYIKRVHHDVVVPRARVQNRYAELKTKYARALVQDWAETTDPTKHVFEDLAIAAFLIELWADMYGSQAFPGFVDIGCGNGLLVHILLEEGYSGWGFDARARKSWEAYNRSTPEHGDALQKRVLLPTLAAKPLADGTGNGAAAGETTTTTTTATTTTTVVPHNSQIHDGVFPRGTFIISNHADELTPWTPILATLSDAPFVVIPCCSHDLGGAKFRAPPPRDKSKPKSTFASLVDWVSRIAEDCGWVVETEMLRIPSTRNTALLGRTRTGAAPSVDPSEVIARYGGTANFYQNAINLTKTKPRGH